MQTVVEVGDWEHQCCGPAYERNTVVELTCLVVATEGRPVRYVESHHDLDTRHATTTVRGRVAEIRIAHPDGSLEDIDRLPSGEALRGFDEHDSGQLVRPWTGDPVTRDSDRYLLTVES